MQLGSKKCILKLKDEVESVQKCIEQMDQKRNQVTSWSWKFPGKIAESVDIFEILKHLQFKTHNQNQNTIVHIVLLELLIDRLLFLIQIDIHISGFIETEYLEKYSDNTESCDFHITTIKDVLKQFSKKHLTRNLQPLNWKNNKNDICNKNECDVEKNEHDMPEVESLEILSGLYQKPTFVGLTAQTMDWIEQIEQLYEDSYQSQKDTKIHFGNMHTKPIVEEKQVQTDYSLLSCNESGDFSNALNCFICELTKIMDEINIPSEMGRINDECHQSSAGSIFKTDKLFNQTSPRSPMIPALIRDIQRISRYIHGQTSKTNSQNCIITQMESKIQMMEDKFVKQENALEEILSEKKQLVTEIELERENMQSKLRMLEEELSVMKDLHAATKENYHNLQTKITKYKKLKESMKKYFTEPLEELEINPEPHTVMENEVLRLRRELLQYQEKINQLSETHQIKLMENNYLDKRISILQGKHDGLLERMQQLLEQKAIQQNELVNKENAIDVLTTKLSAFEQDKQNWQEICMAQKNKIEKMENEFEQVELDKQNLEKQMKQLTTQMDELENKHRILTLYPDLNGPLCQDDDLHIQSIEDEIGGQIEANKLRIALLTEQTKRLENAFEKVKQNGKMKTGEQLVIKNEQNGSSIQSRIFETTLTHRSDKSSSDVTEDTPRSQPSQLIHQTSVTSNNCNRILPQSFKFTHNSEPLDVWSGPSKCKNKRHGSSKKKSSKPML